MGSIEIDIAPGELLRMEKRFIKKATHFSKELSSNIMKAAFLVERDSKKLCPVDTGNLRASIRSQKIDNQSAKVFTDVEYADYVEEGTRYQKAQPFMMPALEMNRLAIRQIMGWHVSSSLRVG